MSWYFELRFISPFINGPNNLWLIMSRAPLIRINHLYEASQVTFRRYLEVNLMGFIRKEKQKPKY